MLILRTLFSVLTRRPVAVEDNDVGLRRLNEAFAREDRAIRQLAASHPGVQVALGSEGRDKKPVINLRLPPDTALSASDFPAKLGDIPVRVEKPRKSRFFDGGKAAFLRYARRLPPVCLATFSTIF